VDRAPHGRVTQDDRTEINGESRSVVWPTLELRTAKEETEQVVRKKESGQSPMG